MNNIKEGIILNLMGYKDCLVSPVEQIAGRVEATKWIYDLFEQNLHVLQPNALVCAFGCGNCEELLHLRNFAGKDAIIFGIDKVKPINNGLLSVRASEAIFIPEDYRDFVVVGERIGGNPDLIIFRNPDVTEYDRKNDRFYFRPENLTAIAEWAGCLAGRGQMLVTTYTVFEQREIARYLEAAGFNFKMSENRLISGEFWRKKGGTVQIPDGFTVLVDN